MEAGIDSLGASELVQQLSQQFCLEVSATLLFDHPSVSSICSYLAWNQKDAAVSRPGMDAQVRRRSAPGQGRGALARHQGKR